MKFVKMCCLMFIVFFNSCGTRKMMDEQNLVSSDAVHAESLDAEHAKLNELAHRYAPLLYVHSKEKYFPTSFEKQIQYLSLNKMVKHTFVKDGKTEHKEVAELVMKHLDMNSFLEFLKNTPETKDYKLSIRHESKHDGRKGDISSAVCYSNPHRVQRHGKNFIDIPYVFFYGYNGMPHSRNPLYDKIVQATKDGVHEGDIEHITVVLNEDESVYGVYFDSHGQSEGRFYQKVGSSDLKLDDGYKVQDGRPIVFSALETHASYNRMGNLERRANKNLLQKFASVTHLLPSDKTDQGFQLDCKAPGHLETFNFKWEETWIAFQGKIGGPEGVGQRGFWTGAQWLPAH